MERVGEARAALAAIVVALLALIAFTGESHAREVYLIDVHSQIDLQTDPQPWTNMFVGRRLAAEWKALLVGHPDRFLLAFDNVVASNWERDYLRQIALWRGALADLPDDAADSFAHGNAGRLWHLPRQTGP